MAKEIEPIVEPQPQEKRYHATSSNGVSEKLPISAKFANRLTRGGMGNPNLYLTTEQVARVKRYIPMTRWHPNERLVFSIMQDLVDRTGDVPTVGQISEVSKGRQLTDKSAGLMSIRSVGAEAPVKGLSATQVQRALNKLQKYGVVVETS